MSGTLLLAHAGAGWQAFATLASGGVAAVFLLAVTGVLTVRRVHDLVLPLSAAIILGGALPLRSEVVHDLSAVAVPVGLALLVALVVMARRRETDRA